MRNQLSKTQAEYQALKSRFDKEGSAKVDELEEIRRKLQARIAELESTAEQARNKASKLEKDKSKLTIEIRDISIQLDEVSTYLDQTRKPTS